MKNILLFLSLLALVTASAFAQAPLIGDVPDQVITQGSSTGPLYFVIGDAQTAFSALKVKASSSNTALVPNTPANLTLKGVSSQRNITVTPVSGVTGVTTITLFVTDAQALTTSIAFTVTVTNLTPAPSITGLANYQIMSPGQVPGALGFTIADPAAAATSLTVVATSSNTTLVPNANLKLAGTGAYRTLQVSPVAGQVGDAVIRLTVTDPVGATTQGEVIFSVFNSAAANNAIKQPHGVYVLDGAGGKTINGESMRDANVRNLPFVDGYVLRAQWATLEPANGTFDFTIIDNIFAKLPANQNLSLIICTDNLPKWLLALPGLTKWTAGTPSVTEPIPWDPMAQSNFNLLLTALGNHIVDGVQLRNYPRLAAINACIPGLKSGIRDPAQINIASLPGYSRTNMQTCVLTHLNNVTANFPQVCVQIGFWPYVDLQGASYGGLTAWEQLREAIVAEFNGSTRQRIGFWMENLAANRPAANVDPYTGFPSTTFAGPLVASQNQEYTGFQMLDSWSIPLEAADVQNILNGTPEDAMDYGFNTFQSRYFEVYASDVSYAPYNALFHRWHAFLSALPAPGN